MEDLEEFKVLKLGENEITKLINEITKEKDLFIALSLYGIYNMEKITTLFPGFKYSLFFQKLTKVFQNYYNNKKIGKLPKFINKISKRINIDVPWTQFINNLSLNEEEQKLIFIFIITNKSDYLLLIILYIIKKNINLIFEFDQYDNITFSAIKSFYDITEQINNNKNNILHIKYINNNLTFVFIKNNNDIEFEKLNDFEIYGIDLKGDKKEVQKINIKNCLNKINNIMIDDDLEVRFKNIQNQFIKQKEINIKQTNELNILKEQDKKKANEINMLKEQDKKKANEINMLKEKINELETKYTNLKGRFIFKAFYDYIFLLFNVNIKLKNKTKNKSLIAKATKLGCNISYIFPIIKCMKLLYYKQTDKIHYTPTNEEIKTVILSQYDKDEDSFIFELFKRLSPQNTIQKIIVKNNELTKLLISSVSSEEKNLQKSLIINEINTIISEEEKKKSISIIKEIINEFEDNIKYEDEYDDEYDYDECDKYDEE